METVPFEGGYADIYDAVYQDKDYGKECRFIRELVSKHLGRQPERVLDFGCGTATHGIELAKGGWKIVGVDRSPAMLEIARRKTKDSAVAMDFHLSPPEGESFDLIISLFAVINYLQGRDILCQTLQNFHEILAPNGLVLLESWNGAAVFSKCETEKTKKFVWNDTEMIRRTNASLDWENQILNIEFSCYQGSADTPFITERHPMHFYTQPEFRELAGSCGLEVRAVYPVYDFRPVTIDDFNVIYLLGRKNDSINTQ